MQRMFYLQRPEPLQTMEYGRNILRAEPSNRGHVKPEGVSVGADFISARVAPPCRTHPRRTLSAPALERAGSLVQRELAREARLRDCKPPFSGSSDPLRHGFAVPPPLGHQGEALSRCGHRFLQSEAVDVSSGGSYSSQGSSSGTGSSSAGGAGARPCICCHCSLVISSCRGLEPSKGPTMPFSSISSTIRAARA